MNIKLKLVWICQFSNSNIRSKLPLSSHYDYTDRAPWITQMINQFKKFEDVELYIISPHSGLLKRINSFSDENVNYCFYRIPLLIFKSKYLQLWGFRFNKLMMFNTNRYLVHRILNKHLKFKPDIINLIGFENPSYSASILDIKHVPVLITVQGIYSNPARFKNEKEDLIRSYLEKRIIRSNKYYCISVPFFSELISRNRKDAVFFWNFFPRDIAIYSSEDILKEYDFVFFARITQVKGVEDLIDAMTIVKKVKSDVSLLIIGSGDPKYINFIKDKSHNLGLDENITFLGELKTIIEVHRQALRARFCVLPSRLEGLPGTVLESMYMRLPVVTTNAGGLPYLNKDTETVLMTAPGDIPAFAENMIRLLREEELCERLISSAREFVNKEFDHFKICRKFVEIYMAVINHCQNGTDIPQELLYKSQSSNESKRN